MPTGTPILAEESVIEDSGDESLKQPSNQAGHCKNNSGIWLPIAKRNLIERETALMKRRKNVIEGIIISSYQAFMTQYSTSLRTVEASAHVSAAVRDLWRAFCDNAMEETIQAMNEMVDDWDGIYTKKQNVLFEPYLKLHRRAFDLKMTTVSVDHLWWPILSKLHQFGVERANDEDQMQSQQLRVAFGAYLSVSIGRDLFNAMMQPANNTPAIRLISAASYRTLYRRTALRECHKSRADPGGIRREFLGALEVIFNRKQTRFQQAVAAANAAAHTTNN